MNGNGDSNGADARDDDDNGTARRAMATAMRTDSKHGHGQPATVAERMDSKRKQRRQLPALTAVVGGTAVNCRIRRHGGQPVANTARQMLQLSNRHGATATAGKWATATARNPATATTARRDVQ